MKAIVLSCDRYVLLTDHMIRSYERSWPSNPFTFRVPYQQFPEVLKHRYVAKVELVPAPEDIKSTVLALLKDFPDDERIDWCIDDKYPVRLDEAAANHTYEWVEGMTDPSIMSVSFCRCRGSAQAENLFPGEAIVNPFG